MVLPPVIQKLQESDVPEPPHGEVDLHRDFGLAFGENLLRDFDRILLSAFPDDLAELILEPDVEKTVSFEDAFR